MSCVMRGSKKTYCLAQEVNVIINSAFPKTILSIRKEFRKITKSGLLPSYPSLFIITHTLRRGKVRLKKAAWRKSPNYQGMTNPKPKNAKEASK